MAAIIFEAKGTDTTSQVPRPVCTYGRLQWRELFFGSFWPRRDAGEAYRLLSDTLIRHTQGEISRFVSAPYTICDWASLNNVDSIAQQTQGSPCFTPYLYRKKKEKM
jgi:hypothetical protein